MSGQKGFSQKDLADQNAKVETLAKDEAKLVAAIERGERTLAENRDKLKETQRTRAAENSVLEQMIQRGIKIASKGSTSKRAALIAALLLSEDDDGPEPEPRERQLELTPTPSPTPAPAPADTPTPGPTSTEAGDASSTSPSGEGTDPSDDAGQAEAA